MVRGFGSRTETKAGSDEGEGGGGMRLEEVSISAYSVPVMCYKMTEHLEH